MLKRFFPGRVILVLWRSHKVHRSARQQPHHQHLSRGSGWQKKLQMLPRAVSQYTLVKIVTTSAHAHILCAVVTGIANVEL
jgi:hypothetical protein